MHSRQEDHSRCEMAGLAKIAQMISCHKSCHKCLHVEGSQHALFRDQPLSCRCEMAGLAKAPDDQLSQALQQPACLLPGSQPSLCLVQDLSDDELGTVFKSGLHLSEWAMLRLVSKQWKAMADSCADCVHVSLTDAAWSDELEAGDIGRPCTEAAFSRLCYAL